MLRTGTYTPGQCCDGFCVPVDVDDDDLIAEDVFVHELREDQAQRLSELLERLSPAGHRPATGGGG